MWRPRLGASPGVPARGVYASLLLTDSLGHLKAGFIREPHQTLRLREFITKEARSSLYWLLISSKNRSPLPIALTRYTKLLGKEISSL